MMNTTFTADSGRSEFLHLLVTQLQNQDPLEPVQQTDFLQQLAQFSTLEGIEKLNTSFGDLLKAHELSEGMGLVGRTIRFSTGDDGAMSEGRVDEVSTKDGRVVFRVGDQDVTFDQVDSVLAEAV